MKIKKTVLVLASLLISLNAHAIGTVNKPMTLDELKSALKSSKGGGAIAALLASAGGNSALSVRANALIDTARNIGLQAGIAYENARIKKSIDEHSRDLDTIYDFSHLMINSRVVPPVVTEARDIYNQQGDNTILLSGAMFKIEKQAYFSSVPPNWRGYINVEQLNQNSIVSNFTSIRPKNSAESSAWDQGLEEGWKDGVEQADKMLEHQFDELNRDFIGMFRFKQFAAQGRITLPIVAKDRVVMTRTENTIALDQQVMRLTVLPDFTNDVMSWKSNNSVVSHDQKETDPRYKVPASTKKPANVISQTIGFDGQLHDTTAIKTHKFTADELKNSKKVFSNATE